MLVVVAPMGREAATAGGSQTGSIAPVGWRRKYFYHYDTALPIGVVLRQPVRKRVAHDHHAAHLSRAVDIARDRLERLPWNLRFRRTQRRHAGPFLQCQRDHLRARGGYCTA